MLKTDLEGVSVARESLELFSEEYEKEILKRFSEANAEDDVQEMWNYSCQLTEFNGGNRLVQSYIGQHPFFTAVPMEEEIFSQLSEIPSTVHLDSEPELDPILIKLFADVLEICGFEWNRIMMIFDDPVLAMDSFIERIFAQSIQVYLQAILNQASKAGEFLYLKVLHDSYIETINLAKSLHLIYNRPEKTNMAKSLVIDIFSSYLEEDYFRREKSWLQSVFWKMSFPFQQKHSSYSNLEINYTQSFYLFDRALVYSDILNTDLPVNYLWIHSNSVSRMKELIPTNTEAQYDLTRILLETLSEKYIYVSIEAIDLDNDMAGRPPQLSSLGTVKKCNDILALVHSYSTNFLLENIADERITPLVNEWIYSVSSRVDEMLLNLYDKMIQWIRFVLRKQKKSYYKIKNDYDLLSSPSPTAQCVCIFLEEFLEECHKNLEDHAMKTSFVTLCAKGVANNFLQNLDRFTITDAGGLMLLKDVSLYSQTFEKTDSTVSKSCFQMLRELCNLFVVKPENISGVAGEGLLSTVSASSILKIVKLRSDFKQARIEKLLDQ